MKKSLLLFFVLCSFSFYGQDQEATLFFRDGTSLKGFAYIKDNWIIKFRLTLNEKPDEWKDVMVKAITFHGFNEDVRYEYQYAKADKLYPLLLEVIEKGNVHIYIDSFTAKVYLPLIKGSNVGVNHLDIKKNKIYFKKPNEELVIKFNNGFYYKKAQNYFKDCPYFVERIKSEKYIKSKTLELLYDYNDLCDNEIIDFNKN